MKERTRTLHALHGLVLGLAAVVVLGVLLSGAQITAASRASSSGLNLVAPPADATGIRVTNLPQTTCTLVGSTRTCELWAKAGTITLPQAVTVPIWGFADDAAGPAQLPGPVLIANAGETLELVLHNELVSETIALAFPGQTDLLPDLVGVATGAVVTYTFPVTNPGTYLYEAGLTYNGARQVAMGLFGGMIVRPAALGQAYEDPATAYDDEMLLVLSEIDPRFNSDPYGFVMTEYSPRYWLINGKAYPDAAEIDTAAGNTILLRYINAGLDTHWMGLMGLRQRIIATDGQAKALPRQVVAETIASGQTVDALVSVPLSAVGATRYAVYDTNMMLHNGGYRPAPSEPLAFGGMMTFIHTITGTAPFEAGPVARVQVAPNPTTGSSGVTLQVQLDDRLTGGLDIIAAEYFTDSIGPAGTGFPLTIPAAAPVVSLTEFIPAATLAAWPSGYPIFYVRGLDANSNWGFVGSAVLNLDKLGPSSIRMSLQPEWTNTTRDVTLRATGDDHETGNNNVVSGTYSLDGGLPQVLTLGRTDVPIVGMQTTLLRTMLAGLPEGLHPISVSAQDSLGNWGVPGVITLTIDRTGPEAPIGTLSPNILDLSGAPPVTHIRLAAVITDGLSAGVRTPLANAEAFVGAAGPNGTGFSLFPKDGLFDEISEQVYFDVPIANFIFLAQGIHEVMIRGLDAAGNWGALGTTTIVIDRGTTDTEGPIVSFINLVPNPTGGAASVTLTAPAADPGRLSNVAAAEWFVGADPGLGQGLPLDAADGAFDSPAELLTKVIDVTGWRNGQHQVSVRARDLLANWGPVASIRLAVEGNNETLILADSFEAGLAEWSAVVGPVSTSPEAAIAPDGGVMGMQAVVSNGEPAYLSSLLPSGETRFLASFYWDPNGTDTGSQAHDILVGLNGGTPVFGIQAESAALGGYRLRGWVLDNGIATYTGWFDLTDQAHALAILWNASPKGLFSLTIDNVKVEELTGVNTGAYVLHEILLGPSGNLDPIASGIEYFDGWRAARTVQMYLPTVRR